MFDEQPDDDPHGECAVEIHQLQAKVAALEVRHSAILEDANKYHTLYRKALHDIVGRMPELQLGGCPSCGKSTCVARSCTMTTTQSREPTSEQVAQWVEVAYTSGMTQVESISIQAYQAGEEKGREAMLKELRAGGVELPFIAQDSEDDSDRENLELIAMVLDYGDRRAADALKTIKELQA